jgi:hypothetical protein
MVHDPENPFSEFEDAYKAAEAKGAPSIGRLPEFNAYKGVCTTVDLKGDGVLVDHEIFEANSGTKGLKIFLEILSPDKVGETAVKGEVHEHVWWISEKTLPRIKWDAAIVLGKPISTMEELARVQWAGHTVEFGLNDVAYNGFVNSRVSFFNAWDPKSKKDDKKDVKKTTSQKADPKKEAAGQKTQAAGAQKGDVDF